MQKVETEIGGKKLSLETGWMAKQADGAVVARYGDTVVLSTAVSCKEIREGIDFLPLTVDYQEKAYAVGRIPGSFFRREGRPTERETLTSRLIDRPLRPLFPKGYYNDTQIISSVLSADFGYSTDLLGIIASSAALFISRIPFDIPVGAVRVGYIDGQFTINPGFCELENSELNLIVAGTSDAVMMVEGGAKMVPENIVLEGILLAHREIQKLIELQTELKRLAGHEKVKVHVPSVIQNLITEIENLSLNKVLDALVISNKTERQVTLDMILNDVLSQLNPEGVEGEKSRDIRIIFHDIEKREMRRMILTKGTRADGRGHADIRPISCEVGILPRTHGSALFTRGETQSLAVVTLGTSEDEQFVEALEGESTKAFMLHYNFPPFSVGEARPLRGPGRREIGHGALAERAIKPAIPSKEEFPYTLRIVSDILESNGSSSMATVCGATLALMDAGVPIKDPVAGIAMGLIKEGDQIVILSDILGLEDHLGDMDFKVTGSANGITAIQMDIKIAGINHEIMAKSLEQARTGRLYILDKMLEAISAPRATLSEHAPRIFTMKINPTKVGEVIGPGGKVIKGIIEKTGVKIDINDSGLISIASQDEESANKAIEIISRITEEVEVGKIYLGKVRKVVEFGAFVEILPNTDGLVHISQLADFRVREVTDILNEGDEVLVKVIEVDRQGKVRLSRKDALREKGIKDDKAVS
ncbi:MAG: polyribonucleotide nucleotidyltransferase [Nitrospirae bacterium RIFCSPLOW2_12_42_9]|nr:MAG: polyribonucleotide nucleotidyltransferase [Nitrospirae bacterium GWA2_42_11]OGW60902.1 MAG: polyribonucleotide nucleotidyltransferase [Nitrospirae bacterium RIFCSPLOW2_12_42_9]